MGLFAPRAVKSRVLAYLSVHFPQGIDAMVVAAAVATGFVNNLAAPLPVGISAAVIVTRLPVISMREASAQIRVTLFSFIFFMVWSFMLSARPPRLFLDYAAERPAP